jgi:lysophospholipase L1-like esterase
MHTLNTTGRDGAKARRWREEICFRRNFFASSWRPRTFTVSSHLIPLLLIFISATTTSKPTGPQRWEAEIQKFEQADRAAMPKPGGVVFVGSSSIRVWDLAKSFPTINAINRGFGGSGAADAAYFADRIVTKYQPRLIVFYSGENDIAGGKSPQFAVDGFERFVDNVRAKQENVPIIYISMKPSLKRWAMNEKFIEANALVRKFIEQQKDITYVDIQPAMLGENGQPRKELFRDDMLHMNEKGYAIWNEKLAGAGGLIEEKK